MVPVGGGGLIAGCATAVKALRPRSRVVGVEPEAGDDTKRSLAAGERVAIEVPRTIADGQRLNMPGELTFAVNRRLVDDDRAGQRRRDPGRDAVRVRPAEAGHGAQRRDRAWRRCWPATSRREGARVGVLVSGGNVGLERFVGLMGA